MSSTEGKIKYDHTAKRAARPYIMAAASALALFSAGVGSAHASVKPKDTASASIRREASVRSEKGAISFIKQSIRTRRQLRLENRYDLTQTMADPYGSDAIGECTVRNAVKIRFSSKETHYYAVSASKKGRQLSPLITPLGITDELVDKKLNPDRRIHRFEGGTATAPMASLRLAWDELGGSAVASAVHTEYPQHGRIAVDVAAPMACKPLPPAQQAPTPVGV